MGLEVQDGGAPGRVRLVGDLDLSSVETFRSAVERLGDSGDVTLDLSGLEFIDSSGIRAVLQVHVSLNEEGRNLVLLSPTPFVRRVFDTLELPQNGVDIREDRPQP